MDQGVMRRAAVPDTVEVDLVAAETPWEISPGRALPG